MVGVLLSALFTAAPVAGCDSCVLLAAPPPTAPPLVEVPPKVPFQSTSPGLRADEEPPRSQIRMPHHVSKDPHAGEIVLKEVLAGGLALALSDGALAVTIASTSPFAPGGGAAPPLAMLAHILASPLWCALAAYAISDSPTERDVWHAILNSYGAAMAGTGLGAIAALFIAILFPPISLVAAVVLLVGARYIAQPVFTSRALHQVPEYATTAEVARF